MVEPREEPTVLDAAIVDPPDIISAGLRIEISAITTYVDVIVHWKWTNGTGTVIVGAMVPRTQLNIGKEYTKKEIRSSGKVMGDNVYGGMTIISYTR